MRESYSWRMKVGWVVASSKPMLKVILFLLSLEALSEKNYRAYRATFLWGLHKSASPFSRAFKFFTIYAGWLVETKWNLTRATMVYVFGELQFTENINCGNSKWSNGGEKYVHYSPKPTHFPIINPLLCPYPQLSRRQFRILSSLGQCLA